ncbi:MAG: ferritin family protein [Thermodesulforhabdaceae bacterium]
MSQKESLIKVYEYALNQEHTGKAFFETSLKHLSVGAAVEAFKTLIEEEEKHIRFINSILQKLRQGEEVNVDALLDASLQPTDFFTKRAESQFLSESVYSSMVPDITVFNTAWLIEKDISDFYARMAEKASGEVRRAFLMLSAWEKTHEEFFRAYRDKLQEIYANLPWGG